MTNSTLKKLLPLLLLPLLSFTVKAQTNVSGFISANTTWDLVGSPYIVVGNALVSQGYTLTINPGVVVKFDSAKALQINGELIAIGTDQSRITFTSNQISPADGDWGEIQFSNTSVSAVFNDSANYVSGCIMKYCDVLYGGSLSYGEVHIVSASPYFNNCNIRYSESDGIYNNGTNSYRVDSSFADHCTGYGLFCTSCGITVMNDSIEYNANGGISPGNTSIIKNSYFFANQNNGAIYRIAANSIVSDNYFINNIGGAILGSGDSVLIERNYFQNNSSNNAIVSASTFGDTIRCNKFIGNQTGTGAISMSGTGYPSNSAIIGNLFDGNVSGVYGVCVTDVSGNTETSTFSFSNNTIRNNSSPSGICCKFMLALYYAPRMVIISNNDFENNTANDVVYLSNLGLDTATNFLTFQDNNFLDPGSQYELYNDFAYGQEDLYIGSNYWGSTNTTHVDSVIYDYFDDATKSVVYYGSLLDSAVIINTSCTNSIGTGIAIINEIVNSRSFPNPFSNSTEVKFGKDLQDAEVDIYNVFGQKVRAIEHFSGNEISIDRGNLSSGIYIYEIVEKQAMVANGKLVIE